MAECISAKSIRSGKWDILKFFLVFLVVLGHAAEYYIAGSETMKSLFIFIYTFHMPVFIFVSGLFAKRTVNEKRVDKMLGYLIIYAVLKLYPFIYRNLAGKSAGFNLFIENGVPWFMLALFWFNLITIIIRKIPMKIVLPVSVLLACLAGYSDEIGDFLVLSRTVVYFPFFFLGYSISQQKIESFCSKKVLKCISCAVLILFAVFVFWAGDDIYWLRPLLTGRNPFSMLKEYEQLGFVIRLIYYLVVSVIGLSLIVVIPSKTHSGLFEKLGQRTLAVYGLHYIVFFFMYEKYDCIGLFEKFFGQFAQWTVIPVSIAVTLFFSLGFFNSALSFLMSLPTRLLSLIRRK